MTVDISADSNDSVSGLACTIQTARLHQRLTRWYALAGQGARRSNSSTRRPRSPSPPPAFPPPPPPLPPPPQEKPTLVVSLDGMR
eukprot:6297903-Prymnesium_polylepis.3